MIRMAREYDIPKMSDLLSQVCLAHQNGRELYEAALKLTRDSGCYNLTLNVWSCNPSAMRFYEAMGFAPQKVGVELIQKT